MENFLCACCGCEVPEGEEYIVGEDVLCLSCAEEETVICERCEERIYLENAVSDDSCCLCQDCYDEHYYRCESCDRIVHENDVCWNNEMSYCPSCYDSIEDDAEIESYDYKPMALFRGNGKRFLGVELEVDEGGKDGDNAYRLKSIANAHLENIYIKSDGSLDDGFEIVSHPMTLEYHQNEMDWETLLEEAGNLGYRSHQTSTCGLHVHVNRNAFGENQAEQEEVISKILFFVEKHWNEMFRFSRRSESNMNRWSARFGFEKTGKEILHKAKESGNGRYTAVNLNNYHTIEFRLFRGTLKYNTFIATLQMIDKICDVALSMSESEMDAMSWSEFVRTIEHSELVQYLKERGLYVNEEVEAEEEV